MATTASTTTVQELYIAYFGRPADAAGLAYYADSLDAGATTVSAIATSFGSSTEAASTVALSTSAYVSAVYLQAFGRAYVSSTDGTFWTDAITAGTTTKELAMVQILNGATGTDATAVTNKVTVSNTYTTATTTDGKVYSGAAAAAAAKVVLDGVTDVASTVTSGNTAAQTAVTALANVAGVTGSTYALTTGVDALTGTANDDIFNANVTGAAGASATVETLTSLDSIAGGLGTDQLNYTTVGGAALLATLTGVENVNIVSDGDVTFSTNTIEVTGVNTIAARSIGGAINIDTKSDVTSVAITGSAAASDILDNGATGTDTLATISITGASGTGTLASEALTTLNLTNIAAGGGMTNTGATGTRALTVNVAGHTAGADVTDATATTATYNTSGATQSIGVTAHAAATTLNINASGAVTFENIATIAALSTVNVTGAGAVTITDALDTDTIVFNAGTSSGNITVIASSLVTATTTLGSGDDTYTSGGVLTTGSVAAGTGADTLIIGSNVSHVNTTALAAKYTGFTALSVDGTLDLKDLTAITSVVMTGNSSLSSLTAVQAAAVTLGADSAATTLALETATGSADALTLKMGTGGTGTLEAFDFSAALTVTGFEILNLVANGGSTAAAGAVGRTSDFSHAFIGATLNEINLTGTAFKFVDMATTLAHTMDGSALTGSGAATSLGITSAGTVVAGSTYIGSDFVDNFTIAAIGSTFNGGAGNDLFSTTSALTVADGDGDLVMHGGTGTDKLTITGAVTGIVDTNFSGHTGFEAYVTAGTGSTSITGAGAFNTMFADGVTITTGALADTKTYVLAASLATVDIDLTVSGANLVMDAAAEDVTIATGSGNDTVSFVGTAFVGHANTGGTLSINTGTGDDAVTLTTGTLIHAGGNAAGAIDLGAGADTLSMSSVKNSTAANTSFTLTVDSGDSIVTGRDKITGFDLGDGTEFGDLISFTGTAAYTIDATQTDFGTIKSHATASGMLTFDDVDTLATALIISEDDLADVAGYLNANSTTLDTIGFLFDSDNDGVNDATIVYRNEAVDSFVEIVGITATTLGAHAVTDGILGAT